MQRNYRKECPLHEFGNGYIQFLAYHFNGAVHIVNTQVFTYQAQEVFGSAGNDDFAPFFVDQPDRIPDRIPPGPALVLMRIA